MTRSQTFSNDQLLDLGDDHLLKVVHCILSESHLLKFLKFFLLKFSELHQLQLQVVVNDNLSPLVAEQVARVPDVCLLDLALTVGASGLRVGDATLNQNFADIRDASPLI